MEDKYFQTDTEIKAWALGGVTHGKHQEVKVSLISVRSLRFPFLFHTLDYLKI